MQCCPAEPKMLRRSSQKCAKALTLFKKKEKILVFSGTMKKRKGVVCPFSSFFVRLGKAKLFSPAMHLFRQCVKDSFGVGHRLQGRMFFRKLRTLCPLLISLCASLVSLLTTRARALLLRTARKSAAFAPRSTRPPRRSRTRLFVRLPRFV